MAKDKKRDESKAPKKITVEAEMALLGLLLAIISLIGLLNQGWLGSFLTYCLVYLFGSMYFVILLFNVYIGLYLFFKKKKPTVVLGVNALATIFLLYFLLIVSSIFDGASISNWYNHFITNFNQIETSVVRVDISKVSIVGGGLIGNFSYALLSVLLTSFVANVVSFIVIGGCFYILFRKPIVEVYKRTKKIIIKIIDKKKNNQEDSAEEFDRKGKLFDKLEDFKEDEEVINPIKFDFEVSKESKTCENECKLSFDIFNEKIFDDEDDRVILEKINSIKEEFENEADVVGESIDISENKKESFRTYTDEELEFYNEDLEENSDEVVESKVIEEQEIPENNEINDIDECESVQSIPYVESIVKVENTKEDSPFDYEISDIYSLLKENNENNAHNELKDEVEINCERINQKLSELNIKASVNNYIIGPCVTRYEIVPEIGVRVSSIVNIENDLKLALAAVKTRMEAPIPGKSAVGIEVANKKRYPVYLKEVIYPFKDDNSKLLVGIGRDLNNKEIVINIDKMPHLLVAGATGSGKSVCINSMIVSLLLRTSPDEVKMILIDPKKVEMLPYANMPHLLCPVVIDPKKASVALKKVVKEMDRRYDEFANNGVRNIEGYNKLMKSNGQKELPNIIVIIDELADLMLVAAKEVEESIQRITQLARAAGIYLIVATQRPSVDVITGVIKANIPSRIAFSVSSQIDSRTIIDRGGAEELLGRGDMLMDISGSGTLNRVQGVYVSDDEIFSVVNYVKKKYSVNFDVEFLNLEEEKQENINNLLVTEDTNNDDFLYEDIKDFVIRNQRASTSLLQRYFTLGYSRAARMIDRLEMEGVIGEANGAKPREVLMTYNKEDNADE